MSSAKRFSDLGLPNSILPAIDVLGYKNPTPIQQQAIPVILEEKDIIACAQTGTGKTAAFCLPSFALLAQDKLAQSLTASSGELSNSLNESHTGPYFVVITPTRELTNQISDVCKSIASISEHSVTTVVGGVSYNPQKQALAEGTDVLIATPGRLEDLLDQGAVSLDQVSILVLDEADQMLDIGFKPSVLRIAKECTSKHQTLLFSATINDEVAEIANELLKHPVHIDISPEQKTAELIAQYIVRISHAAKPSALKAALAQFGAKRSIVFARTKYRADTCAKRLKKMGYRADSIHSEKTQAQRNQILKDFTEGKLEILVATDILSRGIDIDQIEYVINYDLPNQAQDYIHRIGRTGRAGAKGFTLSFVSPENEETLAQIQKLINQQIPTLRLKNFDVEAAEFEAGARSAQLQARRTNDPDVEAVIKELAAKERKKRKQQTNKTGTSSNSPQSKRSSKQNTKRKSEKRSAVKTHSKKQSSKQKRSKNH